MSLCRKKFDQSQSNERHKAKFKHILREIS